MLLRIDLEVTPQRPTLLESDDFGSFKVEVVVAPHTWVDLAELERLGPGGEEWRQGLEAMIAFAAEHGWTDEGGRVRAHVDLVDRRPEPGTD